MLKGALDRMWNIFNTLQLIIALELLRIAIPSNVAISFGIINDTINLQVVPKAVLYNFLIARPFGLPTYE